MDNEFVDAFATVCSIKCSWHHLTCFVDREMSSGNRKIFVPDYYVIFSAKVCDFIHSWYVTRPLLSCFGCVEKSVEKKVFARTKVRHFGSINSAWAILWGLPLFWFTNVWSVTLLQGISTRVKLEWRYLHDFSGRFSGLESFLGVEFETKKDHKCQHHSEDLSAGFFSSFQFGTTPLTTIMKLKNPSEART